MIINYVLKELNSFNFFLQIDPVSTSTWLNPMLYFMQIICFEQVRVHHPLDLLAQPQHDLHAVDHQAHTCQCKDRAQDY